MIINAPFAIGYLSLHFFGPKGIIYFDTLTWFTGLVVIVLILFLTYIILYIYDLIIDQL